MLQLILLKLVCVRSQTSIRFMVPGVIQCVPICIALFSTELLVLGTQQKAKGVEWRASCIVE